MHHVECKMNLAEDRNCRRRRGNWHRYRIELNFLGGNKKIQSFVEHQMEVSFSISFYRLQNRQTANAIDRRPRAEHFSSLFGECTYRRPPHCQNKRVCHRFHGEPDSLPRRQLHAASIEHGSPLFQFAAVVDSR